jgi:hypothetical protein
MVVSAFERKIETSDTKQKKKASSESSSQEEEP